MASLTPHSSKAVAAALVLICSWAAAAAEEAPPPESRAAARDAIPSPLPPGYEISKVPDLEQIRRERIEQLNRDVDAAGALRNVEYRRQRSRYGRPTFSIYEDYY